MLNGLQDLISGLGLPENVAFYSALAVAFLGLLIIVAIVHFVARAVILRTAKRLIEKTETKRDNILLRFKVFSRLTHIVSALALYQIGPGLFDSHEIVAAIITKVSLIYLTIAVVLFIDTLMSAGLAIYSTYPVSRSVPITSFVQIGKLVLYFFGAIGVLSVLLGESPLTFLAGFGALTAVLMLVFKDPILGFVAGIQLSANKMVAVGDWIEMPKYGVDGDIMEIALTTVKIRNFDKTITTIPTQSLINDSFKNWRGMQDTGGRRIKRSISIDVNSVGFCDAERLARFSKIQYIADYIASKNIELTAYNAERSIDEASAVNGRRMTNLGTFRAYIEAYLRAHPKISDRLTFLVRQLKPTETGVPIEIYVFTTTTNWVEYEGIQADIFDHLLAAASEFDLRLFQNPTGGDFRQMVNSPKG